MGGVADGAVVVEVIEADRQRRVCLVVVGGVDARAAVEDVRAGSAGQDVVVVSAVENVAAASAAQVVISIATVQRGGEGNAVERVGGDGDAVIAGAGVDDDFTHARRRRRRGRAVLVDHQVRAVLADVDVIRVGRPADGQNAADDAKAEQPALFQGLDHGLPPALGFGGMCGRMWGGLVGFLTGSKFGLRSEWPRRDRRLT